ncbi:hypothetical protein O1G21_32245 [Kitasatospora cathayae]|uniref:Uncharacterized protein n=1 Tax=Kitasatospora cathayae TaxID=3004092 RepID=A0ABY7QBK4_9ACTN|nr:hypothetical protein [Kitasatospora sp. HUAS 3-15]WBP90065.1 hypothetical protein O1G21_32245 [Kitasatospora sp. HUAS 3-15]
MRLGAETVDCEGRSIPLKELHEAGRERGVELSAAGHALGATLFERVLRDEHGEVPTAAFRRYRLPAYADPPFLRDQVWQALEEHRPLR